MPVMSSPPDRPSNLGNRVGNGMTNRPQDILWVKEVLRHLGRYNHAGPPNPTSTARCTTPSRATSATAACAATASWLPAGRPNAPCASNWRAFWGGPDDELSRLSARRHRRCRG